MWCYFKKVGWFTDSPKLLSRFLLKMRAPPQNLVGLYARTIFFRKHDSVRISSILSEKWGCRENQPILDPY